MRIIAASRSAEVERYQCAILGTSRLLEEHADGTNQLTGYDFLLVFCSHLRSRRNHCEVISHQSADHNYQQGGGGAAEKMQ